MKAITVEPHKPQTAHLEDIAEPDVRGGSALVEAIAVGVCGTDAGIVECKYGYLLTWQASFAGDHDRAKVNVGTLQPNLIYQLRGGTHLRSSAVMTYNFENDT